MLTIACAAMFFAVTAFLGLNVILLFDKKHVFSFPELAGLSYLVGMGAVSAELFFMWVFRIPPRPVFVIAPFVILTGVNLKKYPALFKRLLPRTVTPPDVSELLLMAAVAFECAYTFFRSVIKPVEAYDAVAIWALKAKILFLSYPTFSGFARLVRDGFHGAHPDYPLLVPFGDVWFYIFANSFNDTLVKVVFPLGFAAFLLVFFSLLYRASGSRKLALVFTFMIASVKQFNDYATIGVADLTLGIYLWLAFAYCFMWMRKKQTAYFAVSVMCALLAFWTKNEGVLAPILLSLMLGGIAFYRKAVFKSSSVRILAALALMAAAVVTWYGVKTGMHIGNDVVNTESLKKIEAKGVLLRPAAIAYEYQRQIFGFKKWNAAWILFLAALALKPRRRGYFPGYGYVLWPVAFFLGAYTLVYMMTPQDLGWHLKSTFSRLIIHLLPLAMFFSALWVNERLRDIASSKHRKHG